MSYFVPRYIRLSSIRFCLPLLMSIGLYGATVVMADEKAVIDAVNAGAKTEAEFDIVHEFITGDTATAKWRKINWHRDLWTARIESVKQNKPLFIWAMNGDPLGCV